MERIIFKNKIKKMFNIKDICYIKLRGSIYFLEYYKTDSIELLRKVTNYQDKTPKEFYNIIHNDYLKKCEQTEQTIIKKKPYYVKMRIERKKLKILKLKNEIKQEEKNLIKLQENNKKLNYRGNLYNIEQQCL